MTEPFSNTTSKPEFVPPEWKQAEELAKRLGIEAQPHPGKWQNLLFTAVHKVLDRLDLHDKTETDGRG